MCTYITAVIPAEADEAGVRRCAEQWKHGWTRIENRHVQDQLRRGERSYLTTRAHCDCGTALGSLSSNERTGRDDPAAEIPALRKRGWSETKIARWLADKEKSAGHRRRTEASHGRHPATTEEELWLGFLRAAIKGGSTPWLGLLVHDYTRGVESERIDIQGRTRERISLADEMSLRRMNHDHLYEFGRHR